ncbi:MAG: type III secretion system outer membrane ring subunit SctC [Burkholderiaceae bacterium]
MKARQRDLQAHRRRPSGWSNIFLAACITVGTAAHAADQNQPFAYIANREAPLTVIQNIAGSFGLNVVDSNLSKVKVSGKFAGNSLAEVLNELGRTYSFDWYVHGGKLYLYRPGDWVTERIAVGARPSGNIREELATAGLLNPKFKVLEQPDHEALLITAPKSYVQLVSAAFKAERLSNDTDLMFFKLRYASVEDRVITLRDKSVITPGVATVLRNILSGNARGNQHITQPPKTVLAGLTPLPGSIVPLPDGVSANDPNNNTSSAADGSNSRTGEAADPGRRAGTVLTGVQADPRTNSIIIRDRSTKYQQYKALIDQLDAPLAMVEIEATLIDIDQNKIDQLGAQWNLTVGKVNYSFQGGESTAIVSDRAGFNATLLALIADNSAKVLAKPTVLTLDNLSAVLDLSQTFYTQVSGERVANVVPVTAGSLLRVSPRIVDVGGSSEIQLQVDIEDGNLKDRAGLTLPTVQKSAISTQASIRENQSILIGGYNRDAEDDTLYKVPGLSAIPYVGGLFQTRKSSSQKITRLFLITPRIIKMQGPQTLSPATVEAPRTAPLAQPVAQKPGLFTLSRTLGGFKN